MASGEIVRDLILFQAIWGLELVMMKVREWTVILLVNWKLDSYRSQQRLQFLVSRERMVIHTL